MKSEKDSSSGKPEKFEAEIGGRKLTIETGRLAGKAQGSCMVQYGDTVVLATTVMEKSIREGIDYFPLLVDYEEKLYAAGKIKGSRFIKREGRPSDEAILTDRLVDRSIRPLFNEEIRHDVQVVLTVLSIDQENDPDIVSLIAASAALAISPIPWAGPVGAVRIGLIDDKWVLNPTYEALEKSELDLVVVGIKDKVLMLEGGAKEISEDKVLEAIKFSQKHIGEVLDLINQVQKKIGQEKEVIEFGEESEEEKEVREKIEKKIRKHSESKIDKLLEIKNNEEKSQAIDKLKEELEELLKEDSEVTKEERIEGLKLVDQMIINQSRGKIIEKGERVDGRKINEIRALSCEVGVLPRTHGSAIFNRGETQVLSIVTLGAPGDEQVLDTMELSGKKSFMHHYNFPGFSVGEVSPIRAPSRREIGHGALAEKAIIPVLPDKDSFPYTIRLVSEVLSSNGSTSQASACASSLALMDAGVPIKKAVAGIAIGLIYDEKDGQHKILTDIQGLEDYSGDMDCKVAGTKDGVTAIQMDLKMAGVEHKILKSAFSEASKARKTILDKMSETIEKPRDELSPYAPRVESIRINPDKIREVIGPGGKVINEIIEKTEAAIDIEDDGLVMVTSVNKKGLDKALEWIKAITREIKVGEIFTGKVSRIIESNGKEIGAIVEILPGHDGMIHISQFSNKRIDKVSDVVKVGDEIRVKCVGVDKERGRIELSHKVLDTDSVIRPSSPDRKPRPSGSHRDRDRRKRF